MVYIAMAIVTEVKKLSLDYGLQEQGIRTTAKEFRAGGMYCAQGGVTSPLKIAHRTPGLEKWLR